MLKNQKPSTPVLIQDLGMMFPTETSKKKKRYGLYKCECGIEFKTQTADIQNSRTKSCGCYNILNKTKHGMSRHKIYKIWRGILDRTLNQKNHNYKIYGGRGISVCDRWKRSFEYFADDMLPFYKEGLSIDRIDVDGNYEPSNCRWVTLEIQARNTRILRTTNTSGYRGVHFATNKNKWVSAIYVNSKRVYIGSFAEPREAAIAYDKYVTDNNLEHTKNGVL